MAFAGPPAYADPRQFLRYLVAALQTVAPAVGRSTEILLHAAQTPPLETLLPLLLNDLLALPDQTVLVLDDYHVIDAPAVHQALAFLLDHLPPQLHLVIATRADPPLPVSRLRGRGQLTELRAADLRFTPEEAALFLREVMGLPLSVDEVTALEARTEGWIAGLQLAALSLQDRPDQQQAEFIAAFTGSHRFVVDYLVDEVLARQAPHVQTFLLQTSIVERLCASLCDAVVLGVRPRRRRGSRPIASRSWSSSNTTICSSSRWTMCGAGIAIISSSRRCWVSGCGVARLPRWWRRCTAVPAPGSSGRGSSWKRCSTRWQPTIGSAPLA